MKLFELASTANTDRIEYLENKIRESAQKYYSDGTSDISDEEFDKLVDELRAIKPDSSVLTKVGWGYKVEADSTPGQKFQHLYGEVGSLDKVYTRNDFNSELVGPTIHASLKLDGISVVLYYQDSMFIRAVTRGDGFTGIDITDKILNLVPHDLNKYSSNPCNFTGAVRGEIVMPLAEFNRFKEIHPEAKNPRNSTAGLINAKEVSEDLKFLKVVVYTIIGNTSEYDAIFTMNRYAVQTWLNEHFPNVVPYTFIEIDPDTYETQMFDLRDKWYSIYPADGIVLSTIDVDAGPKGEIIYHSQAFKFAAESKVTTVRDIVWKMSKTNSLVPTVIVDPVILSGTNAQRATGFNAKYIKDNSIGIGAKVEISKHGEIIPNINKVVECSSNVDIPTTCPRCGSPLIWAGVHLKCDCPECGNMMKQDTLIWLSALVPTDGLGDALKLKFLNAVYGADISIENIMTHPEFDESMIKGAQFKLFASMMRALHDDRFTIPQAIRALNIPRFGDVTSNKFAQYPDVIRKTLNINDTVDAYCIVNGVLGHADSCAWSDNLNKVHRLKLIESQIIWTEAAPISETGGKVAITGKLSVPRKQFEEELRAAGFVIAGIHKDTRFLITDDPESGSSKNVSADRLGIQKITEAEFRAKFM